MNNDECAAVGVLAELGLADPSDRAPAGTRKRARSRANAKTREQKASTVHVEMSEQKGMTGRAFHGVMAISEVEWHYTGAHNGYHCFVSRSESETGHDLLKDLPNGLDGEVSQKVLGFFGVGETVTSEEIDALSKQAEQPEQQTEQEQKAADIAARINTHVLGGV